MVDAMKLYNILFEEHNSTAFPTNEFGLIDVDGETLVLFNVQNLMSALQTKTLTTIAAEEYVAGIISVEASEPGTCLDAIQITAVAGNSKWPGAGTLMYSIASEFWEAPITSDREHSTTPLAKKVWKRIATNPEFSKAAELDNFFAKNHLKRYLDFKPDGSWRKLPGPRTPEPEDDCPLPKEAEDFEQAARLLGTSGAWQFIGSTGLEDYMQTGTSAMTTMAEQTKLPYSKIKRIIATQAFAWFRQVYHKPT